MNDDEASRAYTKALELKRQGDFKKALKLLEISQRLAPESGKQQIINEIKNMSFSQHSSNSSSPDNCEGFNGTPASSTLTTIQRVFESIRNQVIDMENRYIAPSMRQYIRIMFCIICVLVVYKFIFKQKIAFGSLPGDIYYSTPNTYVSAPIASSLLISFFLNAGLQLFNRQQ
mmetsp:Transcript_22543/g.32950  ORF Transcript_22543/g.32950 Transcript_22543/m.32950 type:complete len:173 (-) Transcript_22543:65-583(-)